MDEKMKRFAIFALRSAFFTAFAAGAPVLAVTDSMEGMSGSSTRAKRGESAVIPNHIANRGAADVARGSRWASAAAREMREVQAKARSAERRFQAAGAGAHRAAVAARAARDRALSLNINPSAREAVEKRFEAQARRAIAAAERAERNAQRLAAEAQRLQTQSMLARLDAAQAVDRAARAARSVRDANRWRRLTAVATFTPEQVKAYAAILARDRSERDQDREVEDDAG